MCLDNVFVTVFLFCFSLLPMAYLRYYPFRIIATLRERRILIAGHLIIFVVEFLLVTALLDVLNADVLVWLRWFLPIRYARLNHSV